MQRPTQRLLLVFLTAMTVAWPARLAAQEPPPADPRPPGIRAGETRVEEKGTFLGVLVRPNLEPRPDSPHFPGPPRPLGVCITHVVADSPAARAHLRRNDVLLQYDDTVILDGDHLANLIRNDRPDRRVRLRVLRDAKEQTAEVALTLGPPLTIAPGIRKAAISGGTPPGVAKGPEDVPAGRAPASVSVIVTPLEEGTVRLTIECAATGKVQTITCTRTTDINRVVEGLPERERNLVRIALQRLRTINAGH